METSKAFGFFLSVHFHTPEVTAWRAIQLAGFPTPIMHGRSGIDPINRSKKIHLADVDSIMTQDGVRHRHVEVCVGDCHMQQVVLPAEALAGRPRKANLAVACACILRLSYAFREGDSLPDAGAHIIDRLLVVLV